MVRLKAEVFLSETRRRESACESLNMNKMMDGRGNLITQVEKLKQLGSKTKKELDNRMVDRAELGEYSDRQIEEGNSEN